MAVIVRIGGCFAESVKEANYVTVDEEGNLHVWKDDEYLTEYSAGMWVDYTIED